MNGLGRRCDRFVHSDPLFNQLRREHSGFRLHRGRRSHVVEDSGPAPYAAELAALAGTIKLFGETAMGTGQVILPNGIIFRKPMPNKRRMSLSLS